MNTTISHPGLLPRTATSAVTAAHALLERFPTALLALAFRFAAATVFFRSGMTKLASWETTVALFEMEYMVPILPPVIGAYLATATEIGAALMLILGLGTRFAAAALLGLTLVIQVFVYPENWPDHLLWASILAWLLTRGPGVLSLDRIIGRRLAGMA